MPQSEASSGCIWIVAGGFLAAPISLIVALKLTRMAEYGNSLPGEEAHASIDPRSGAAFAEQILAAPLALVLWIVLVLGTWTVAQFLSDQSCREP